MSSRQGNFDLDGFLDYVDTKFDVLPYDDATLNAIFDVYQKRKKMEALEFFEMQKAGLVSKLESGLPRPAYWDTSVLDVQTTDLTGRFDADKVSWLFGDCKYANFEEFVRELNLYNWEVTDSDEPIGNFELCKGNRVFLRFFGIEDGEDCCSEKEIEIVGNSGTNLSYLEFMFVSNNELFDYLVESDQAYYEGFEIIDERDGVPVIQLVQGS